MKLLTLGFAYSYFWVATTAIYLLLRNNVDGTELDEMQLNEDDQDEPRGLPELKIDESGIPVAADDEPATQRSDAGAAMPTAGTESASAASERAN